MSILDDALEIAKDTFQRDNLDKVQHYTSEKFGSMEKYLERTETKTEPDYVRGFVAGMIGGLVGVGVKMLIDRTMPNDQPKQEHDARIDVVEGAEDLTGVNLTNQQEEISQQIINIGFGALIGGVYGVVAEAAPGVQAPGGIPFGAALWTTTHKMAMPLLDLAPSPLQDEAGRQVGQLAGHVAYGATVEVVRRGVRHLMDGEDLL